MPDHLFSQIASSWRRWKDTTTNRKILGAALVILIFDVCVKLFSTGKELAIAAFFGTGDVLDAYLIAFMIPALLINVTESAFNAAVIPTYIQVRERDGNAAVQRLLSGTIFLSLLLLLAVLFFLALLAPFLLSAIGSHFSVEKLALTRRLFYLLLPTVAINGISCIYAAVLNANERFALAKIAAITIPVAILIGLFTGAKWGIYALATGTLAGYALELCVVAWGVKQQGIALMPRYVGLTPEIRQVIAQYIPMFGGAFLMSSSYLIDQAMAAALPAGSVSSLNYANRVVSFPLNLAMTAVGTALVPYFSRMTARNEWPLIRDTVSRYLRVSFLGGGLVAILLIAFSRLIVKLLFQRGSFYAFDTEVVAEVLRCYALQIPFYASGIVIVRVISSSRANKILFWGAAINIIVNVMLNYVLMKILGVAGIALSTSIVFVVSFSFVFYHYRKLSEKYADNEG